ncbi:MAG: AtpZ/AtpI family protein [Planctomycetes bacterium]|nr:AtpZ/AtpI family protein [Planctomycetota bacterium]
MPSPPRTPRTILRYSHLGLQFVLLVTGGVLGGRWIDGRFGGGGLWTILGLALGFAAGLYVLVRETARIGGPEDRSTE